MKWLVAAGSFGMLALAAFAQGTDDQQVLVAASKEAIKRAYISPQEFDKYKGEYDLANGKTLYLTRKTTRTYARVDDQAEHEITCTGTGKFQAIDGQMSMQLVLAAGYTVSGELRYVDEDRKAAGLPEQMTHIRFASR